MTTVAVTPNAPAASATAMPWLPPLTATMPAARSASLSDRIFANAPRALNEPERCSSSSLSVTGTPRWAVSPGLGSVGVRSTCGAMRSAAARMSAMSIRFPTTTTLAPAAPRTPRGRAVVGCAVGRQRSGTTSGAPMRAESAVSSSGMVWLSRSASTRLR